MSEAEEGPPEFEMSENGGGVILGYWDHEKTPALIQDLERSVSLVEDKCKQLLEELIYYKRCGEESRELDRRLVHFESKSDISKPCSLYGSEPDLVHRQNLINFRELQQVFEERFEQKLSGINKELTEVSRKIGLKNNVVLFPTKDYLHALNTQIEKKAQKSWSNNKDKFIKTYLTGNTKSGSRMHQRGGGEGEFSKITKNELALYQKLSSMNKGKARIKKRRGKAAASGGEKGKLSARWKTLKLRQDLPSKRKKSKSGKKTCKKMENGIAVLRRDSCSPHISRSTLLSLEKLSDSGIERLCKLLSESIGEKKVPKSHKSRKGAPRASAVSVETKNSTTITSCSAPLRSSETCHTVPRLQLLKRRMPDLRISASEHIHGTKRRDVFTRSATLINKGRPVLRASSEIRSDTSKLRRNGLAKHKRKVWTTEKPITSPIMRKPQVKCTISLPRGFFEDTKSVSNFDSKPSKKYRARGAHSVNSKVRISDCQSTNAWNVCKMKQNIEHASGDGSSYNRCAKQSNKWTKPYSSLLNTKRKDSALKNTLRNRSMTFVDEELQCLEKEIVCSLDKYKKFLQFYSTFLRKNRRTKPSKIDSEASKFRSVKRKLWDLNPVYVTAMKKAFREVEALQKKLKLWTDE